MNLAQLPLTRASTALAPTSATAVGTAARVAKPRLVGTSTISDINKIAPRAGSEVASKGLKGPMIQQMIRNNPGKAAAVATAGAIGSVVVMDDLVELANSGIDSVASWAQQVLAQVDEIEAAAGFNDLTPNEDGLVGKSDADVIRTHHAIAAQAEECLENAVNAAGGWNRFVAIEQWRAIDDDLKQIAIDAYKRKNGV